jgi:hypothetical protein
MEQDDVNRLLLCDLAVIWLHAGCHQVGGAAKKGSRPYSPAGGHVHLPPVGNFVYGCALVGDLRLP